MIGGLYPDYEQYWTRIQQEPEKILLETNKKPTPGEVNWARFAEHTPHDVYRAPSVRLSGVDAFSPGIEDVAELKKQGGKDIYLIGGARTVASLIDAGLVDELRLIVYPLIAGDGTALFGTTKCRQLLNLLEPHQLSDGRVILIYDIKATTNFQDSMT